MNGKSIVVVLTVAVGAVVLASLGLSLLTPGKPVEFFGMNIASGDGQFIPPAAGGLALAVGIVWLLAKSKRAG